MVKSELLSSVAEQFPAMTPKETEKVVGQIIEIMIEALASGNRIEVRGFGSITLRHRKARTNARNPKNGQIVATLEKYRPHFKPGLELRKKANNSLIKSEIKRTSEHMTAATQIEEEEFA
ncbi:MAG: integration host factor subunit beta [Legionellales bacterium]|jgi:integration host factor subunit beta|nr:integration host factor subunit beta [Legionellales bacterium]